MLCCFLLRGLSGGLGRGGRGARLGGCGAVGGRLGGGASAAARGTRHLDRANDQLGKLLSMAVAATLVLLRLIREAANLLPLPVGDHPGHDNRAGDGGSAECW